MDENIVICRCEEIMLHEIEKAIESGAITLDEIKKQTRAGMGPCQGRICSTLILKLLEEKGYEVKDSPPHSRMPVRPFKIKEYTFGRCNE